MSKIPALIKNILFVFFIFAAGCTNSIDSLSRDNLPMQKRTQSPESKINVTVEGKVLDIKSKDEILIHTSAFNDVTLHITENTSIWDGIAWIAEMPTQEGDYITAYGVWESDRANFYPQIMYVNIEDLHGIVDDIDKENSKFIIKDSHQGNTVVFVDAFTKIMSESGKTDTYQNIQALPKSGDYVEVIGRKIAEGTVIAVNLSIP
jgi:hypothetical protein